MLPTKLRSVGRRAGMASPRSTDRIRTSAAALELLALVEVLGLLVAGEVDDPVAERAGLLPDREEHGVAEPAAAQHHGRSLRKLRRASRSGPSRRPARPGSERASTGASTRRSRARSSRAVPSPGPPTRRSARRARSGAASRRRAAPCARGSAAGRTGPAGSCGPPPARARRPRRSSGVRRSTATTRAAEVVLEIGARKASHSRVGHGTRRPLAVRRPRRSRGNRSARRPSP